MLCVLCWTVICFSNWFANLDRFLVCTEVQWIVVCIIFQSKLINWLRENICITDLTLATIDFRVTEILRNPNKSQVFVHTWLLLRLCILTYLPWYYHSKSKHVMLWKNDCFQRCALHKWLQESVYVDLMSENGVDTIDFTDQISLHISRYRHLLSNFP